ncbi:MAG: site-specific DNA-methyltransferase, partial [Clostridium sp.]|nr:site-specific DNA-methyltransferase [Clostridium sp.]
MLIKGDNLAVMKCLLEKYDLKDRVDLVYIDPPFSTNNKFTISDGKANTISRSLNDTIAYEDTLTDVDYIEFMRERLILIREMMSNKGSIYYHIDYKMGHYVKVMMDEIFGKNNYMGTITRIKCNPKNFKRKSFGNIKDMILFYSKTGKHIWNEPRRPFTEEDIERLFPKINKDGRRYTTIPLHAPGETQKGATGQPWRGMLPPKGRHWRSSP